MKQFLTINAVFIVGLLGAWLTRKFGTDDTFYLIIAAVTLTVVNGIFLSVYLEGRKKKK